MKKNNKILIGIIFVLVILVIGISYAWLTDTIFGKKEYILKAGKLDLILDETSNGLQIQNSIPIKDENGLLSDPATFSVINNSDEDLCYEIYLDDADLLEGEVRVEDKYSLAKGKTIGSAKVLTEMGESPNRILDRGSLRGKTRMDYQLRLWFNIEEDGYFEEQIFKGKLRIEAAQCEFEEETAPPVIVASTTDWSDTPVDVSIQTVGNAESGVKNYEYYIAKEMNDVPTKNQVATGTTDNKITISDRGYYFVYYRSISMIGSKSNWSIPAIVKYDDQEIVLTLKNDATHDKGMTFRLLFNNVDIKLNDVIEYNITVPSTPSAIDFNDQFLCDDFTDICSIRSSEVSTGINYQGDIKIIEGTNYINPSIEDAGYRFFDFTYEVAEDRRKNYTCQVIVHRF